MKCEKGITNTRPLRRESLEADFVVVGGGVAGTCAALAAAREGLKTILIQDRPVLGGNGSSEVRLWWLGATCHGNTNNRWAREPGIVNELMLENLYRNPEGNPVLVDTVLLDAVHQQDNLTLLLNTAVDGVEKPDPDTIRSVTAFCPQNSTRYTIDAALFCDASGDGILGFMSGAAFRMGAEKPEEFGEPLAPDASFGELLGDSMYFYTKDTGRTVHYEPPSFAKKIQKEDIRMLRYFNLHDQGCQLWWIESGGRLDTVHQTEQIKWDLWALLYGVWDYVKNSGEFPDASTLNLEWVGTIPGKRESRRFEGDAMLTQDDLVHARSQSDVVAFGGWAIDLHPADGSFSKLPSAIQYLTRRLYPIPYRCLYSRNIRNLFLGGRTMSASHVAFGSTRVMATLGQLGEVIGRAAALCLQEKTLPAKLPVGAIQKNLLQAGFHLPGLETSDFNELLRQATVTASSTWAPTELPAGETWLPLEKATAQMLPLNAGPIPEVELELEADEPTTLQAEWWRASLEGSHTPDQCLGTAEIQLASGPGTASVRIDADLPEAGYAFLILRENPQIKVRLSDQKAAGLERLNHSGEQRKGDCHGDHLPADKAGCEAFDLWFRERDQALHKNLALRLIRPLHGYGPENVKTPLYRPTILPNAWVAEPTDRTPELILTWDRPVTIRHLRIFLDPDWDHPLETVIKQHPKRIMPSLITSFEVYAASGRKVGSICNNHQAQIDFNWQEAPVETDRLIIRIQPTEEHHPPAIFGMHLDGDII
jgi:hypothetical protein